MIEFVPRPAPVGHVFDLALVKAAVNAAPKLQDHQGLSELQQLRKFYLHNCHVLRSEREV